MTKATFYKFLFVHAKKGFSTAKQLPQTRRQKHSWMTWCHVQFAVMRYVFIYKANTKNKIKIHSSSLKLLKTQKPPIAYFYSHVTAFSEKCRPIFRVRKERALPPLHEDVKKGKEQWSAYLMKTGTRKHARLPLGPLPRTTSSHRDVCDQRQGNFGQGTLPTFHLCWK